MRRALLVCCLLLVERAISAVSLLNLPQPSRTHRRLGQQPAGPWCNEKPRDGSEPLEFSSDSQNERRNHFILLYRKYRLLCERKPLRTKAITQSVVGGIGCILSQYAVATSSNTILNIDWSQVHAFMISGLLFEGPFFHLWYGRLWAFGTWLETKFRNSPSIVSLKTVVQVVVDQTLGVLLFFPTYFFLFEIIQSVILWKPPNLQMAQSRLQAEFLGVIRTNYVVWPLANWIVFNYVPQSLRVLATSIVAILWNAFLCSRVAGVHG